MPTESVGIRGPYDRLKLLWFWKWPPGDQLCSGYENYRWSPIRDNPFPPSGDENALLGYSTGRAYAPVQNLQDRGRFECTEFLGGSIPSQGRSLDNGRKPPIKAKKPMLKQFRRAKEMVFGLPAKTLAVPAPILLRGIGDGESLGFRGRWVCGSVVSGSPPIPAAFVRGSVWQAGSVGRHRRFSAEGSRLFG